MHVTTSSCSVYKKSTYRHSVNRVELFVHLTIIYKQTERITCDTTVTEHRTNLSELTRLCRNNIAFYFHEEGTYLRTRIY